MPESSSSLNLSQLTHNSPLTHSSSPPNSQNNIPIRSFSDSISQNIENIIPTQSSSESISQKIDNIIPTGTFSEPKSQNIENIPTESFCVPNSQNTENIIPTELVSESISQNIENIIPTGTFSGPNSQNIENIIPTGTFLGPNSQNIENIIPTGTFSGPNSQNIENIIPTGTFLGPNSQNIENIIPTGTFSGPNSQNIENIIPTGTFSEFTSQNNISIEIVSEEEMALIESALAAARYISAPSISKSARSISSITMLSKRRLSSNFNSLSGDIEDVGLKEGVKKRLNYRGKVREDSLLYRFRRKRGISVTDITGSEWCEEQMEFILLVSRPEPTKAMKAGSARHSVLEKEVIKRVKVQVKTVEDAWAMKMLNFMVGVNQLLTDGLTRELPLIGFIEGAYMVGVVDEIQMSLLGSEKYLTFIDTKTRVQATVPSEPQQRNGRLQLMCYKYLWDNLVSCDFQSRKIFDFFSLNRNSILSEDIRAATAKSGFSAETLDDMMRNFQNSCSKLLPVEELLLRYELQKDHSLLSENKFVYDHNWVKEQINSTLEFWRSERQAKYTSEEERWKCNHCRFSSSCPINSKPEESSGQEQRSSGSTPP